jgi:magnesium-transporting ATPase (P-type)
MQSLTILLAPALMAATIYMVLGRTIVLLRAEHHSLVRVKWLTKLFVGCDVFSFLTQSSGGGIMASGTQSGMHTGQMLIIAGLALQLAFFGFFVVVAGIFHFRVERDPTTTMLNMERGENSGGRRRSWRTVLWTLYTVSLIILVRATFRLIEYAGGNDGYLISHEIFLYIFDALFMFAVLVILFIFHPAAVVSGEKRAGDRLQLT